MIKKSTLIFIFILFPIFLHSNDKILLPEIGEREPIMQPIGGYNAQGNSYPDPYTNDEIILTINKNNYLDYADTILTTGQIEMFNLSFKLGNSDTMASSHCR